VLDITPERKMIGIFLVEDGKLNTYILIAGGLDLKLSELCVESGD